MDQGVSLAHTGRVVVETWQHRVGVIRVVVGEVGKGQQGVIGGE